MLHTIKSPENPKAAALKLLAYCQANDWAGYDPYDALNSKLFKAIPFLNLRLPRLILTQLLKISPVNLRSILLVPKTENPKALALFLMAFLKLERLGLLHNKDLIPLMIQKLINLRSQGGSTNSSNPSNQYWCWGYSFPWQTRTVLVPKGYPNLVCTTFVANALLDAYETEAEARYLDMAVSAAEYILNDLYWEEGDTAGFSYPLPSLRARVHNANFLGAALLCRTYKHTADEKYLKPALKTARYSAAQQHDDGSWVYGELSKQRWIDNFHTGYNLCGLRTIGQCLETSEFEPNIQRGFAFYRRHFFMEGGAPKYFHDRTYPIDIHSVAQSIITLLVLGDLDGGGNFQTAHSVLKWVLNHMVDEQGYFFFQVHSWYKNKISYMRWSQAWILLALVTLLEETVKAK